MSEHQLQYLKVIRCHRASKQLTKVDDDHMDSEHNVDHIGAKEE